MIEAMKEIYELTYMSRDDFEDWRRENGDDPDKCDNHYAFLIGYIRSIADNAIKEAADD